jgi:hypothetical protein
MFFLFETIRTRTDRKERHGEHSGSQKTPPPARRKKESETE